mmetsp:Transcript_51022/g.134986  ORF Transcript_51022/g.134986 Transcript_51022/m.134986 type:complete len:299 (-) Transcript_51022:812-1708(-)
MRSSLMQPRQLDSIGSIMSGQSIPNAEGVLARFPADGTHPSFSNERCTAALAAATMPAGCQHVRLWRLEADDALVVRCGRGHAGARLLARPLKDGYELVDRRALLALVLEAAVDDGVQPADERRERLPLGAGQARVEAGEEAVRLVELLLEEVEQVLEALGGRRRVAARQQLERDDAERERVDHRRARALHVLGRHVQRGAGGVGGLHVGDGRAARAVAERARDAKVADARDVGAVEEQVGGLDVAVDDGVRVQVRQPAHNVAQDRDARRRAQRAVFGAAADPPAKGARSAEECQSKR